MKSWPEVRLGELLRIKHGFAFKSAHFSDKPGAVVLTPGNFEPQGGLKLRPEKDRSYRGDYPSEFKLKTGDLLVVMTDLTQTAAILGSPAVVPDGVDALHNQRLGKVVDLRSDLIDRRYLYYVFNSLEYREWLRSTATGSTVRHTSPSRIYEHKFHLPLLETQRRIAAILGAYDDLIEVNRRRVAVLEEMARGLFEDFARDVDEKALLFDVAAVSYGKNLPKSQLVENGPYPVYGASKVIGRYSSYTHQKRTILLGCRGTVGEFQISQPNSFITNNSFSIEPADDVDFPWLFYALKKRGVADTVSGSAQPQITLQGASRVEILYPSADQRAHFHSAAFPMLELSWLLVHANEKLAASRDLLLPRLISGQLSIEAAERELEAAA